MKRTDLHQKLQVQYPNKQGYGIEKGPPPSLENVWFVIPPPLSEEAPFGLSVSLLRKANEILGSLQKFEALTDFDRLVLGLLVKREALQSSRMEGTFSTIDQLLTPRDQINRKEKSAQASVIAYAHVLEKSFSLASKEGPQIFTEDLLRKLHVEMMSRDPEFRGKAGLFRDEVGKNNYATIGGLNRPENSTYNPVPPKYLRKCLKQNLDWMKDEDSLEMSRAGLGPGLVVRMAKGHWHFEAIHPFADGNGRVGRILMVLYMVSEGLAPLYISGYIEAKKKDYYLSLQAAQMKCDEAPLVHFLCKAIIESYEEAEKTKEALVSLPDSWVKKGNFRQGSASLRALKVILENPILSVKLLEKRLKISQPAAKRAIDQLCDARILRERTGMGRNRIFAAEEVIELLARPFGESTVIALERAASLLG
ncbi:MAG TPA: Fic family protein [Pseudobdellovibrionaceae bacterium]|jgi:Fic family protein